MLIQFHDFEGNVFYADENGKLIPDVLINEKGQAEQVFRDGDAADQEQLFDAFRAADPVLFDRFNKEYGWSTRDTDDVSNEGSFKLIFRRLYPDEKITISRFLDTVRTGVAAGSFARKPAPAPAAPRPRSEDGRFQSQLLAEYHRMLDDPSVPASAITERLRVDRAMREAVEAERRQEAGVPAPTAKFNLDDLASDDRAAILEFADLYTHTPLDRLKPIQGAVTMGTRRYTWTEFCKNVEWCSKAGLIR